MSILRSRVAARDFARFTKPRTCQICSNLYLKPRNYTTSSAPNPSPTPIEKIIRGSIKATGPVPYSNYMQMCLSHPELGYYMNPSHPVFGTRGDFITSPEISQVFGELVGIWLLQQWLTAGAPSHLRVVELGPGRGTLMDDIIRVVTALSRQSLKDREIVLVETSPTMRELQKQKLSPWTDKGWKLTWLDSIEDMPENTASAYTMLVAHEFFDALPIDVFKKSEEGWNEIRITTPPLEEASESSPQPLLSPLTPSLDREQSGKGKFLTMTSPRLQSTPVGETIEISHAAWAVAQRIGEVLLDGPNKPGGCSLIIDYGEDYASGDSFRAFKNHKQVSPFYLPGECDLTANVDFAYLRESLQGLNNQRLITLGPISQALFLSQMGLVVRVNKLLTEVNNSSASLEEKQEQKRRILDGARRLSDTGDGSMGDQYKFFGIVANSKATETSEPPAPIWPFVSTDAQ